MFYKTIEFSRQDIAEIFFVTKKYRQGHVIIGYFSLTKNVVKIKHNILSGPKKKKITRSADYDEENHWYFIALPLIVQLGKNIKMTTKN